MNNLTALISIQALGSFQKKIIVICENPKKSLQDFVDFWKEGNEKLFESIQFFEDSITLFNKTYIKFIDLKKTDLICGLRANIVVVEGTKEFIEKTEIFDFYIAPLLCVNFDPLWRQFIFDNMEKPIPDEWVEFEQPKVYYSEQ